jgi:hypothetical protein
VPKKIMFESDEAAQYKTVQGWVSSTGQFFGDDERTARWAGSTHQLCECGNEFERGRIRCKSCQAKKDLDDYEALPKVVWDGESPLYSDTTEKYYFRGEILDEIEDDGKKDWDYYRLFHCDPVRLHQIDESEWEDELDTEDDSAEIPNGVRKALDALNEEIGKADPVAWMQSKRTAILDESSKRVSK